MPKFDWDSDRIIKVPQQFEEYYNDHFGLRDLLIFYQQFLSYKLFKISSSPLVTVGEDDWLFFNGDAALDAYLGLLEVPRVHLETYRWVLKDRGDWLADKGISYVFLPVPNKESVYPEYIPSRIRRNAGVSLYDQVVGYLNAHPGFSDYIDLKDVFLHKKMKKQLFLKTDSHWNMEGVFEAYKQIGAMVKAQHVPMRLLKREDINWEMVRFSGDLAKYLHLTNSITEIAPDINGIKPCSSSHVNTEHNKQDRAIFDQFIGDSRKFKRVQDCTENTTSILVIHDSFGLFIKPLINSSFGTVYYVNNGFNEIKDFIEIVHPDIVIDQRVERNILSALVPDREIESEMVSKQFPQLKHNLLQIDKNSDVTEVDSSPDTLVRFLDDGLQVRSAKPYPALGFQYDPGNREGSVVVQIRLSSQQETQCLLYYTTKENSGFIPSRTLKFWVSEGYNEIYFRLPDPGSIGKLQFHPGTSSGEYLLHSFVVKR